MCQVRARGLDVQCGHEDKVVGAGSLLSGGDEIALSLDSEAQKLRSDSSLSGRKKGRRHCPDSK